MGEKDYERIEVKDFDHALKLVKDPELKKVVLKFRKDLKKKIIFSGIYTSRAEIRESIKERVYDFLNSYYNDLKSEISSFRKKGVDVDFIDYKILSVPLKIKLLSAEFNLQNYSVVLEILSEAEKSLKQFSKE